MNYNIVLYANYDMLVCYVLSACYVVCVIHWISHWISHWILRGNNPHVNYLAHLRLRLPERLRLLPLPPFRPLERDRDRFLPPTAGILLVCGILI